MATGEFNAGGDKITVHGSRKWAFDFLFFSVSPFRFKYEILEIVLNHIIFPNSSNTFDRNATLHVAFSILATTSDMLSWNFSSRPVY